MRRSRAFSTRHPPRRAPATPSANGSSSSRLRARSARRRRPRQCPDRRCLLERASWPRWWPPRSGRRRPWPRRARCPTRPRTSPPRSSASSGSRSPTRPSARGRVQISEAGTTLLPILLPQPSGARQVRGRRAGIGLRPRRTARRSRARTARARREQHRPLLPLSAPGARRRRRPRMAKRPVTRTAQSSRRRRARARVRWTSTTRLPARATGAFPSVRISTAERVRARPPEPGPRPRTRRAADAAAPSTTRVPRSTWLLGRRRSRGSARLSLDAMAAGCNTSRAGRRRDRLEWAAPPDRVEASTKSPSAAPGPLRETEGSYSRGLRAGR